LKYRIFFILLLTGLLGWTAAAALESPAEESTPQQPDRIFDMKIPEGFSSEAVDEPGILKWRKGSGEIYLITGDLFGESSESLFKVLKTAAEKNKSHSEHKVLKIKGGRALMYKETMPEDKSRLTSWHLIVVTNKKIVYVDFTAPAGEFSTYAADFQAAINSFKLKAS